MDGIRDGEIYGWAIDHDDPLQPVKITAYIDNQPAAEALALYYRPDLAANLSCSGQQGFYIDLTGCCDPAGEVMVDVRFPNGESLPGGPIRAHIPEPDRSPHSTLLFMHIPKTAGTAFREAATANYKRSEVAYVYEGDPLGFPLDPSALPLRQRTRFRFVVGHFVYGAHVVVPNDYSYFTIVRSPLNRIWSQYNWMVENSSPFVTAADGRTRSLEEMFENRIATELDNITVRYFAGVYDRDVPVGAVNQDIYDLAIQHLEEAFPYVGIQERIEDAYEYLRNRLRWKRTLPPAIVNAGLYTATGRWSERDEKLMQHFNKWDIMLHEHIGGRAQPDGPLRTRDTTA